MLTQEERNKVVDSLQEAHRTKIQTTRPSAVYPHIEFEDAYAISAEFARRQAEAGEKVVGYKVGLTSIAMRRSSKIDEPDYGYLYESMMYPDGAKIPHKNFCVPRVELELAFILKAPLKGPGVTMVDVIRATEYVIPAIELIDARVDEPRKIYDTISDNGAGAGIVMGGTPIRPDDPALRMVPGLLYVNAEIEETGVAAGVMGHPANGVAWLANKLAEIGEELKPGQIMLAGSFVRPVWAKVGDTIRADFGRFGSISIQFT